MMSATAEDQQNRCGKIARNTLSGFLSCHKMFHEKDLIRMLFVCVCLCLVSQAYPCGTNPLKVAQKLADAKGMTVDELLSNNDFRQKLNSLYQKYAKCISIVETGQFKRSVDPQLLPNDSTELETPAESQSAGGLQRRSDSFYKRSMFMKPRRLRNYSGEHFYFYK